MLTHLLCLTLFAPGSTLSVLAEAGPTAGFAGVFLPPMDAQAAASTLLALASHSPMLTQIGPAAFLALAALSTMLADVRAAALDASTPYPSVLAAPLALPHSSKPSARREVVRGTKMIRKHRVGTLWVAACRSAKW